MATTELDQKRIGLFLLVTFGWAWAASAFLWWLGGLSSPYFSLIAAVLIMPAPAIGHVVTRWLTREGWQGLWLQPKLRRGWRFWLLAWLGTAVLIILGIALFFLLQPSYFDPNMTTLATQLEAMAEQSGQPLPFSVQTLILLQSLAALGPAILINAPFMLGEEFGWRAYLQPKLMPLGPRRAMPLMGIIWGLWHAPIILMGYNYGVGYFGAPITGLIAMCWMTFTVGTWLGWLTWRAGSVWPAVIGHAILNGFGPIAVIISTPDFPSLVGPAVTGVIGGSGFLLVTMLLLGKLSWWDVVEESVQ
jgi:uncharacterized protein